MSPIVDRRIGAAMAAELEAKGFDPPHPVTPISWSPSTPRFGAEW